MSAGVPPAIARIAWTNGGEFDASRDGAPPIHIDSSGRNGPSPFDTMLAAIGTCASVDVVDILAKRRTPVRSLSVEIVGQRVDGTPRRLESAELRFTIAGEGIERVHAERAIELAVTKYCSVGASIRTDAPITWSLVLDA